MNAVAPCPAEISRVVTELARRFPGVRAWWGEATGEWWAMTRDCFGRDRLIEATDPAELGRRVEAVRSHIPHFARAAQQTGAAARPTTAPRRTSRPAASSNPQYPGHGRHEAPGRRLLFGRR
ncbi:hypothetical protein GCM10010191_14740 [Actinomadura vinacea]|uniref:Uncharacterized protein n=1 Tax=Actinomadura vinacea TaxID=115336 RepID=A0ABN3IMN2_9ACTN